LFADHKKPKSVKELVIFETTDQLLVSFVQVLVIVAHVSLPKILLEFDNDVVGFEIFVIIGYFL
jgi:hypothetical protein